MNNIQDEWCVWNECKRDPVDGQCWEGDGCPECWDGIDYKPEVMMNVRLVNREAYLFRVLADAIGEWPRAHRMRSILEDWEHCPVCDKHVPDVRFKGTVHDLEQIDFSCDAWMLADGSVACEDGHGGLMVELCADCIALDRQISVRQITKL